ncbi:Vps54-domain-containing protein [Obba rivulosa]|uniref:Vps54-domain-containing protein n=1 Tax=Obba rivulosa TaxID=1052685 RepID=A0A8E2AZ90_9APHY|nr:Vps54-domain-containing protein [Obba rivulosa]
MSEDASTPSRPASPVGDLPNFSAVRPYRFTWDAANRRPGPGSVSETTEGKADYFAANAAPYDLYGNTSFTSLPLASLPAEWSSVKYGFNAISTVVNSPHKRSAPPAAHSRLPAVPPADLPRVRRKDFDAYLAAVGPEWARFEQNAEQGREGAARIEGPRPSASLDLPSSSRTLRQPSSNAKALPPLDSVPAVFFDPAFNLGDPRTFAAVTEQDAAAGGGGLEGEEADPGALAHALPLLEKLSHYADTIEQHLIREISLRSTSFFAALANLQDLQTESEQCLDRIGRLRGLLRDVDEKGARRGLEVVRREGALRNVDKVRDGVRVVGGVVDMMGIAKSLVAAGQWGEALDVIEEIHRLWEAAPGATAPATELPPEIPGRNGRLSPLPTVPESPPSSPVPPPSPGGTRKPAMSIPISSLHAFASLPSHLRTLTMEITSSLTSEFVNTLRLDLTERIDADQGANPDVSLRDRLRPVLQSLARTKGVREATVSWREAVLVEVRGALKRRISRLDFTEDDPVSQAGSTLVKELRSMDHLTFMELARTMYKSLMLCVEGIQRQNAVIVEVLEALRSPKAPIDIPGLQEELTDILSSAAELANARASKVISIRAEQHAVLDLYSFWVLFNESFDFVVKSEVICRRMIVGLRGTVISQAKTFLQTFHQAQISQSAKLVEDEQWNPAEVPPSAQHIVDLLVDSSIHDPLEFVLSTSGPPSSPLPNSPLPPPSPSLTVNGASAPMPSSPLPSPVRLPPPPRASTRRVTTSPSKHLRIEDRTYFAVSATLEVLMLLADYLKVIINLPTLTTDTMSRIIELLKAFNSRTCQVVLGAGAMRSAGLKNITAKHLALASQSLSIMISLIPYVREAFRRHLSQKQAVMLVEFDKLKRDYQEHQNEIHAKLIAIMGDRLTTHIASLQAIRWDVPKDPPGVNDYMEVLVRETVTLHKVLSRYTSTSVVEYVMTQVFAGINHRLSEEYTKIELPSPEAKERLLADVRFLQQKLSGLKHVAAPTAMLETVVSEKRVARPPGPGSPSLAPAAPPPTTASRFSGMLRRAGTLNVNGRSATVPAPAPVPVPSPAAPPVPERMATSPVPPAILATPSPEPSALQTPEPVIDGPRVAELPAPPRSTSPAPIEQGSMPDGPPPATPPKADGADEQPQTEPAPGGKEGDDAPAANGVLHPLENGS